jgi:hypothetical protein
MLTTTSGGGAVALWYSDKKINENHKILGPMSSKKLAKILAFLLKLLLVFAKI